jgi:hypothetical protein
MCEERNFFQVEYPTMRYSTFRGSSKLRNCKQPAPDIVLNSQMLKNKPGICRIRSPRLLFAQISSMHRLVLCEPCLDNAKCEELANGCLDQSSIQ